MGAVDLDGLEDMLLGVVYSPGAIKHVDTDELLHKPPGVRTKEGQHLESTDLVLSKIVQLGDMAGKQNPELTLVVSCIHVHTILVA
jgi:hypothetical protein